MLAIVANEAQLLLTVAAVSALCHWLLLSSWRKFAPSIFGASFLARSDEDKMYLENSFVTLVGVSVFAPTFAIIAIMRTDMTSPIASPTWEALVAEGISLGYMAYDCVWMFGNPEHDAKARPIMLFHHILSIVGFPYAMLRHRAVPFVLFFIATEITGIPQHLRMLLLRFGLEETAWYLAVGVSWTVSFFLVRAVPSPWLIAAQIHDASAWARYSTLDWWLSVTTLPLPFLLNAYWLYLLVAGVVKALRKQKPPSGGGPTPSKSSNKSLELQ